MKLAALLAQRPAAPVPHFDVADGFAITLIFMLFTVLTGVALVARRFRRREKRLPEEEDVLDVPDRDWPDESPPEVSPSPFRGSRGVAEAPWERDADWWKQAPADDE